MDVCLLQCGQKFPCGLKGQLEKIAKFAASVSEIPDVVSCGGVVVDICRTLHRMLACKVGL